MASPSLFLSAGRPMAALMKQAMGAATGRAFGSAAGSSSSSTPQPPPKRPTSIVEPTYTYMPPGSSMREPLYFSTSDPVYFVDPKPDAAPGAQTQAPTGEEKAKVQTQSPEPSTLRKVDFSAISGKKDDGRQASKQ